MNAHQRRIEKRRKIRKWGKEAAEYQMHMLALGRRVCQLIQQEPWEIGFFDTTSAIFDASDQATHKGWTYREPYMTLQPVRMSPQIMLDAKDFCITEKVKL
jgi:hypothetical protein